MITMDFFGNPSLPVNEKSRKRFKHCSFSYGYIAAFRQRSLFVDHKTTHRCRGINHSIGRCVVRQDTDDVCLECAPRHRWRVSRMCPKTPMTSVPNVPQDTDDVCPECAPRHRWRVSWMCPKTLMTCVPNVPQDIHDVCPECAPRHPWHVSRMCPKTPMTCVPKVPQDTDDVCPECAQKHRWRLFRMCPQTPMTSVPNVPQDTDDVCSECARCMWIKYNFFSVDNPYLCARALSLRRMYVHTLNPFCVISWACSAFRIMATGFTTSRRHPTQHKTGVWPSDR